MPIHGCQNESLLEPTQLDMNTQLDFHFLDCLHLLQLNNQELSKYHSHTVCLDLVFLSPAVMIETVCFDRLAMSDVHHESL